MPEIRKLSQLFWSQKKQQYVGSNSPIFPKPCEVEEKIKEKKRQIRKRKIEKKC